MSHGQFDDKLKNMSPVNISLEALQILYEALPAGVMVFDSTGKVIYINREACEILEVTLESAIGRLVTDTGCEFSRPDGTAITSGEFPAMVSLRTQQPLQNVTMDVKCRNVQRRAVCGFQPVVDLENGELKVVAVLQDVTAAIRVEEECKQTQDALKKSEENYRIVAEFNYDWEYWLGNDGKFLYVSPSCKRVTGYPPEAFLEDPELFERIVHPEDRAKIIPHICSVSDEGNVISLDFRIIRRDGEERWMGHVCQTVYDTDGNPLGIRGSNRDITSRKLAEQKLVEAEAKYRGLVEESLVGVYIIQDGKLVYVNPRLAEIFGYAPEEIIGKKTPMDLTVEEDREMIVENMRRRIEGEVESIHYVFKGLRKDGKTIDVEVLGTRTVYQGKPAIIGSLMDITERKKAEQRNHELEQHKREFYRRTILAATEGKLVIAEKAEIYHMLGQPLMTWDITKPEDLSVIRQNITDAAAAVGMDEDRISDLVLCIGEATTNALKHSGGGQASLYHISDKLVFLVSDHGKGIQSLVLPEATLRRGYSTAGSLGMGYRAMISLADKLYLATGPGGTTLAIEMKIHVDQLLASIAELPDTWNTGQ